MAKGAMWVWMGFLMGLSVFGFFFIILNQLTAETIVAQQATTLTNQTNIDALNYAKTMWYYLPLVFIFVMMWWALNQAQKQRYY